MHLRQLTHLTAAPPPPSSPTIATSADYSNVNAAIQVVTTILIIIMAVAFVLSSLFFCFHRSIAPGCCGVGDGDEAEHDHRGDGRRRRTPGLTRAVIDTFPTYLYSDVRVHRLGNGELECAVCLSQFKDVEILRLLPTCCHVFHPDCIDKWLLSRPTCPVCRADVGSISNLAEHGGGFQSIFGIASSDDGDHDSIHIDQQSPVQIRSATPEAMIRQELNYPKAHSTGHSPAWTAGESDRFTLRLPDQVRDKLVTSGGRPGKGTMMGPVSSPRSWYRQPGVAGWCRSGSHDSTRIKKHNYHRFKARNVLDRFGEPVASSNVLVSPWSGSHESDGPIDYSTLVKGQREEQYA